jgi:hypothetical protein
VVEEVEAFATGRPTPNSRSRLSSRRAAMTRALLSPSREAVDPAEEDSDYFATEAHYLSLAHRIVAAFRDSGGLVLVTGDPPAIPRLLSQALRKSSLSRHVVIDIACHADLTSEELSRARSVVAALLPSNSASAASATPEPVPPLLVFADFDQLSDQQIGEVFESTQHGGQKDAAALLLARSAFQSRLEEPSLRFLKERLAARFEFQEVGQDEGIEFLRHQLAARHAHSEPRGIPAGVFRGLALSGVLVALGIGAFLLLQSYYFPDQLPEQSDTGIALPRETAPSQSAPSEMPPSESAPIFPRVPPVAALRAPTADRAAPRGATSAGAPDPGQAAPASGVTLPATALPPAQDAAKPPSPSPAAGSTVTQSAQAPEPGPLIASPAQEAQQTVPKTVSPPASVPSAPSAANQSLSPTEIGGLVTRGDGFLSAGDIVSARLFYERAADAGSPSAALRLGATFDPGFLSRVGIRGIPGDSGQAASWYRRARDLGDVAAEQRLKDLDQQRAAEPTPRR